MAYPQRGTWGAFINPEYSRLQSQIQQQTQALLRERHSLSNNFGNGILPAQYQQQPVLRPVQSQKYIKLNSDRSSNPVTSSKGMLNDKVRELVELCKKENNAFGNELIKILGQQRNIYSDMVSSNQQSSQKTQYFGVSNPIIEAQKQSSVVQGSREQQLSNMSSGNQSPTKVPKSNIRQAIQNNPKLQVGDDLIQMIEEIERKALNEIEKLREEKIDLMKQLKQEIQSNNELQKEVNNISQQLQSQAHSQVNQKQLGSNTIINGTPFKQFTQSEEPRTTQPSALQEEILRKIRAEMDNLRRENESLRVNLTNRPQPQQFNSQYQNPQQVSALRQRVTMLQSQLYSRDELIRNLTFEVNRLNQQQVGGSNPQQLDYLLQQGESIRQNTIHLIRLKQRTLGNNAQLQGSVPLGESKRIRQLEELLLKEEEDKANFLNDLLVFKQKYQQLEEENRILKRQSKFGSSDLTKLSPIMEKSSHQVVGASLDDYERLLSQMRAPYKY